MNDHDDFAFEPIPGLPATPPKGEDILWQGQPATVPLALQAYKLGWVLAYFAGLIAWRGSIGFGLGGVQGFVAYGLPYIAFALAATAVIVLLAWVQARATVYTVTSARVAMRIGAALTVTLNLPFTQVAGADLSLGRRGTGNIALSLLGDTKLAYVILWPHARPWHVAKPQPMLRCIPDAARVARLIADAAETRLTESQPILSRTDAPMGQVMAAE